MRVIYKFTVMYGDSDAYDNSSIVTSDKSTINLLDRVFTKCDTSFFENFHNPDLMEADDVDGFLALANELIELYNEYAVNEDECTLESAENIDSATDRLTTILEVISDLSGVEFYNNGLGGEIEEYTRREIGENAFILKSDEAEKRLSMLLGVDVVILD